MNKLLILMVLFLGLSCQAQDSKVISQTEFKKGIQNKDAQLIDVRSPEEFKSGHIKNAKNIDYNGANFKTQMAKLDKTKPVYVYCAAGGRSAKAAKVLTELGFKKVYDLKGGYGSWNE